MGLGAVGPRIGADTGSSGLFLSRSCFPKCCIIDDTSALVMCSLLYATIKARITKTARRSSTLLFTQSKEMPGKTRKSTRKHRRRTLRRIPRKVKRGGSQTIDIPTSAFKHATPVNSDNEMQGI